MNNFDMPTQLDVINFHNTHDTLCVPKGMTLKQLVEDYDRLNNILDELEKYIHNELVLDFYNDDMPCELIINKMEKKIKELKENK